MPIYTVSPFLGWHNLNFEPAVDLTEAIGASTPIQDIVVELPPIYSHIDSFPFEKGLFRQLWPHKTLDVDVNGLRLGAGLGRRAGLGLRHDFDRDVAVNVQELRHEGADVPDRDILKPAFARLAADEGEHRCPFLRLGGAVPTQNLVYPQ